MLVHIYKGYEPTLSHLYYVLHCKYFGWNSLVPWPLIVIVSNFDNELRIAQFRRSEKYSRLIFYEGVSRERNGRLEFNLGLKSDAKSFIERKVAFFSVHLLRSTKIALLSLAQPSLFSNIWFMLEATFLRLQKVHLKPKSVQSILATVFNLSKPLWIFITNKTNTVYLHVICHW